MILNIDDELFKVRYNFKGDYIKNNYLDQY